MRRFGFMRKAGFWFAALLAVLALGAPPAMASPTKYVAKTLGAQTGNGSASSFDAEHWRDYQVTVRVTAGSGTVNPFRVWLEGTPDGGTVWYPIACTHVVKGSAAAPGTANTVAQRDVVSEVAVVTSETWNAQCHTMFDRIRASWAISGTTPSETFEVLLYAK